MTPVQEVMGSLVELIRCVVESMLFGGWAEAWGLVPWRRDSRRAAAGVLCVFMAPGD